MIKKIKKFFLIFFLLNLTIFQGVLVYSIPTNNKDKVPIFSVNTIEKKIALTFDLNWAENDATYEILDLLDKYNAKGTFFVIGRWVKYPDNNEEKIREISKRGHEIGNHSFQHPNFLKINRKQIEKEIVMTEKIIYDITGKGSKYFRFPSGGFTNDAVKQINELGLTSIQWSKDSLDWMNKGLDFEYKNVMKNINAGDIVLFHNNGKYTVKNLDMIIPELQKQGYDFVTIDELLHKKEFFIDENGKQFKIS
ncbi:MAG: polysaccharide deacetylase family protein [Sarcina sp.]